MGYKEAYQVYDQEKVEEYHKLTAQQKLEWLEKMSRFLYYFMPEKANAFLKN